MVSSPGETAYALLLQGLIRLARRHTIKAQAEFQEAIHVYPHLAVTHMALAYSWLLRGNPDDTFAAYQQALRIDTHDRDLYLPLLSGSGCRVEDRVMVYWERMDGQGLDREQVKLRLEIVRSFQGSVRSWAISETMRTTQSVPTIGTDGADSPTCLNPTV